MSKHSELRDLYDRQLKNAESCVDHWRDMAMERREKVLHMQGKLEVYEKLFRKFLKEPTNNDEVFIFQGRVFEPLTSTLSCEFGSAPILSVTFRERILKDENMEEQDDGHEN